MIKYFCDKCRKELKENENYFIEVRFEGTKIEWCDLQLCKKCFKELKKRIEQIVREINES